MRPVGGAQEGLGSRVGASMPDHGTLPVQGSCIAVCAGTIRWILTFIVLPVWVSTYALFSGTYSSTKFIGDYHPTAL
jgi:hypothetical protein